MTFSSHASLRALLLGAIGCQAASSDGPAEPSCTDPTPVLLESGAASGFVKCADGAINRVASAAFEPVNTGEACHGDEGTGGCLTDADCAAGPHGRCIHFPDVFAASCGCEYACATDEDCGAGTVCLPPELSQRATRPRCVAARCMGGADCASGECGLSDNFDGCRTTTELVCRDSTRDACRSDGDCESVGAGYTCDLGYDGKAFGCVLWGCEPGRPLLVAGTPRVAPTVRRADWRPVTPPSEAS
ncbi:MAG: hypothetical protein IV100_02685 [Myxococcales bacterium]|nr:hypothetical protein [Myxococcales bacterium]